MPILMLSLLVVMIGSIQGVQADEGGDISLKPLKVTPSDPEEGDAITVRTAVHNAGPKVNRVLVEGLVNSKLIHSQNLTINENGEFNLSFTFKLTSDTAFIVVLLDPKQEQNDTNRTNNYQSHHIEIEDEGQPGLILVIVGLAVLGGGMVAYLYVRNEGRKFDATISS